MRSAFLIYFFHPFLSKPPSKLEGFGLALTLVFRLARALILGGLLEET